MALPDLQSSAAKKNLFDHSPKRLLKNALWKSVRTPVSNFTKKAIVSTASPLDQICGGLRGRAQQFGLTPPRDNFLHNQSFPSLCKGIGNETPSMGDACKRKLKRFDGNSLNSYSFSHSPQREPFVKTFDNCRALNSSWAFCNYVGGGNLSRINQIRNPNKAIVTINARTTKILVANKMACVLLGMNSNMISQKKLCDYFVSRKDQHCLSEAELEENGELVFISGKVMDIVGPNDEVIPVSVWARHLENEDESRCLVVMERVDRTVGLVTFDEKGKILNCDKKFSTLHGYSAPQDLEGLCIKNLIPSLVLPASLDSNSTTLPKEIRKQRATGRTKDGTSFPLSILITPQHVDSSQGNKETAENENSRPSEILSSTYYHGTVWVFSSVSGLITVLPDGTIHSCNSNFSLMLFGYTQDQLVGKNITVLIPSFYDDLEFLDTDSMPLPPLDDDDDDSNAHCGYASDGRTTADSMCTDPPRPMNPLGKSIEMMVDSAMDEINALNLSPSPVSRCNVFGEPSCSFPEVPQNFGIVNGVLTECSPVDTDAKDSSSPVKEHSDSSSQCIESLRQLSISESQDTLHSCTNSITESDINANVIHEAHRAEAEIRGGELSKPAKLRKGSSDTVSNLSLPECEEQGGGIWLAGDLDQSKQLGNHTPPGSESPCPDICTVAAVRIECGEVDELASGDCAVVTDVELSDSLLPSVDSGTASTPKSCAQAERHITMTPPRTRDDDSVNSIPEGYYFGVGRHSDGSNLAIVYHIRRVELDDGSSLYCLWVMRDPEETGDCMRSYRSLTLASSHTSALSHNIESAGNSALHESYSSQFSSCSSVDVSDVSLTKGEYNEKYTVLQQIGKGAFGCVKKAYRNSDGLLVVTKFIRKSKVYKELWIQDTTLDRCVPLEVSLLIMISHPNIVKVLDVFENDEYVQMVMEKHGAGMDLFEFIDRVPKLDEPLASYIFRQIVSAVSYLHSLFILHRDIKDENVILDEKFNVKLIDFGSATFMGDELFSTFCGTMEYCSPEVIQGEKYRGPELEMWALGVTLYTLMCGENPFVEIDETLRCDLKIPSGLSNELAGLIERMLEPDPMRRLSLSELEEHSWINQPVDIKAYKFEEVVHCSAEEANPTKYHIDYQLMCRKPCDSPWFSDADCSMKNNASSSLENLANSESSSRRHFSERSEVGSVS